MKKLILIIIFAFSQLVILAQNFHFQVFTGLNRTSYDLERYSNNSGYLTTGARFALGLDNFQLGAEIENNLTDPFFVNDSLSIEDNFGNKYYGGFFRVNISSLPAYRFGLILKGGAGIHRTEFKRYFSESPEKDFSLKYENSIGYHGGIGFSSPLRERFHFEFMYQFNWTKRKSLDLGAEIIPSFRSANHSFHFGFSYNLVVGKAAKKAKEILSKRPW